MSERRTSSRYYANGAATEEFTRMMTTLAEALGAKITEAQIRSHAQLLGDVEYPVLRLAFWRAANEIEFGSAYPSVGKLRTFIRPNADDAALLAWTAFSRAAEAVGSWQNVDVDDPNAAAALVAVFGSWPSFCELEDGPKLALLRQEFLAAYRNARRFETATQKPVRLFGLCGETDATTEGATWIGKIGSDGTVQKVRDVRVLPPAKDAKEIPGGARDIETGTEEETKSARGPRRSEDREGRQGGGDGS